MDEFAKLIDGRINLKTKGQFMKTVPAVVTIGGTDTATVNLLSENATCELLNMTGSELSVGDQVQVYSCGKTMYIGASRNIVESGATYTAGDNIAISSGNVIKGYRHVYSGSNTVSVTGDSTNGWIVSWLNTAADPHPPSGCTGAIIKCTIQVTLPHPSKTMTLDLTFFCTMSNGVIYTTYAHTPHWFFLESGMPYEYFSSQARLVYSSANGLDIYIDPIYMRENEDTSTYSTAETTLYCNGMAIVYFN